MLLGLHAQHGDAGRASLELGLGLEGVVSVGARSEERVGAEEVVQGDVAELVLLVGEAHVAVVGGAGGRARGVRVGGHAGRRAAGQHAGGDHGAAGRGAGPQVVGNLLGQRKSHIIERKEVLGGIKKNHLFLKVQLLSKIKAQKQKIFQF